jgi:hypothetical protein
MEMMMAHGIQDPIDLARVLTGMSYGGLVDVAKELVAMNAEDERDVKTAHGMASTLFDWAQAMVGEGLACDTGHQESRLTLTALQRG